MTNIDANWSFVRLSEIADFRNGINFNKSSFGTGIKVINVKDFQDYTIATYDKLSEINPNGIVRAESILQEGDIVFVRSNGNRELIGRSMYIASISEPITHSAFTIRLRFTSENVYPRYYAYFFRSDAIRQALSAQGGGTNISNLNQQILENLSVPLPPPNIQRRTATILSAYDDLIENNTQRIKLLEQVVHDLYREWFVEFRFPGHEEVPLVKTELRLIPQAWEVGKFTDLVDVLSGGTPSTKISEYWDGKLPFFSPKDAGDSFYVLSTERNITEAGLKHCSSDLYPKDTIFITARGTVGKVRLAAVDMTMNQSCYALIGKDGVGQHFVFLQILAKVEELQQRAHGAVFDTIIVDTFHRLEIVKPNLEIIEQFCALVAPFFDQILKLLRKNENLRQTRDLLLPRLLSGQVDVSELKIEVGE